MSILKGDSLEAVVNLLNKRGAYFYHACQLKDFATYVQIGGIPSRHLMQQSQLKYTGFETDDKDHNNGVWPKVFGNLTDAGRGFARGQWRAGKAPTPNPYGPILLVANPSILLAAQDVAICLRSAGGRDFNRDAESLSSAHDVERLFKDPVDTPDPERRSYIKYSAELGEEFGEMYTATTHGPSTYNPEVSCTLPSEYLPFSNLSHITVDRYFVHGRSLVSMVSQIASRPRVEIRQRNYLDGRVEILDDLQRILSQRSISVKELEATENISPRTKDWAHRIISERLDWQYNRFATYLREGTLI